MKKGRRATKTFLVVVLPIFMLVQLYFWNLDINYYVKGLLFASKVYECKHEEELKNLSIPLPKRTVLRGREDACSPFYWTYARDRELASFFKTELSKLKSRGEIETFWMGIDKEFEIKLLSGSHIRIYTRNEGPDKGGISIKYIRK